MTTKEYINRTGRPDAFETKIYYVEEYDLFLIVDREGAAEVGEDWVVTSRDGERLTIERYYGQPHHGVAIILSFLRLQHGEQYTPPQKQRELS